MRLEVAVEEKGKGVVVITPVGHIDSDTYLDLEEEVNSVLSSTAKIVIFDMHGVEYISSAGLGIIFKAKKVLTKNMGKLCIVNITKNVKKVFDMINALPEQDIFANIEELDNYLDHIQRDEPIL